MLSRFVRALQKFSDDGLFTDAAAVAFYTLLSGGPLLVLLVTLLSKVDPTLVDSLATEIKLKFGSEGADFLLFASRGTKHRIDLSSVSGWIGGSTLLVSSSLLFAQLQQSFNKIFRSPKMKNRSWFEVILYFAWQKLVSVLLVFLSIVLAVISLVLSSTMNLWLPDRNFFVSFLVDFSINFLVFTLLFWVIFRWTPDARINTKKSFNGAVITSLLFIFGKIIIGFYLGTAAVSSIYGAAGSALILLLWVYYSSAIVFVGAELASVWLLSDQSKLKKGAAPHGSL